MQFVVVFWKNRSTMICICNVLLPLCGYIEVLS